MGKILDVVLIIGFLVVDWLIFHDFMKAGEMYTVTEYLTGALSLIVFVNSVRSLLKN